jgi:hypothetical protein
MAGSAQRDVVGEIKRERMTFHEMSAPTVDQRDFDRTFPATCLTRMILESSLPPLMNGRVRHLSIRDVVEVVDRHAHPSLLSLNVNVPAHPA